MYIMENLNYYLGKAKNFVKETANSIKRAPSKTLMTILAAGMLVSCGSEDKTYTIEDMPEAYGYDVRVDHTGIRVGDLDDSGYAFDRCIYGVDYDRDNKINEFKFTDIKGTELEKKITISKLNELLKKVRDERNIISGECTPNMTPRTVPK
jgi:hypothetical protein